MSSDSLGRKQVLALLGVALLFAVLFYALNSGITVTNDGSHFALIDSLVERGSPELLDNARFAVGDSAKFDGKIFSDRNPGLALFGYAFYRALAFLTPATLEMRLDPGMGRKMTPPEERRLRLLMLIPPLSGSLLFLALFSLLRHLRFQVATGFVVAGAFLFGTIALRYSTVLYSHAFVTLLVVTSHLLFFKFGAWGKRLHLWSGTFLLSYAVLSEHIAVLLFVPLVGYVLMARGREFLRPGLLAGFVAAGAVPMIVLAVYNQVCFESPFSIAHFHHATFAETRELNTLFVFTPTPAVLWRLLFGASKEVVGRNDLLGLVNGSPFVLLGLAVMPLAALGKVRVRTELYVLLAGFALVAVFAAANWSPYGGWDRDYRFFLIVVPLLSPFVALPLEWLLRDRGRGGRALFCGIAVGLFGLLVLYSVRVQFAHIRHYPQVQFPNPLVNLSAALVNVGLIALLGAVLFGLWRMVDVLNTRLRSQRQPTA